MVRAIQLERTLSKDEILALYLDARALWRQSRRRPRRLARLFRQGAAAADARAKRRCWSRCRNRRKLRRPDRSADAARARARPRARPHRRGRAHPGRRGRARQARDASPTGARPMPALAPHAADQAVAAAPDAQDPSPDHRRAAAEERSKTWRASGRARSGPTSRSRSSRSINATGEVLARVASADYFDERRAGQVDMTQALRSPGSALKPFIYGLALRGRPRPSGDADRGPAGALRRYAPENFDLTFQGTVTVRRRCNCRSTCRRWRCSTASAPAGSPRGSRRPAARWCCRRAKRPASPWGSAASASRSPI